MSDFLNPDTRRGWVVNAMAQPLHPYQTAAVRIVRGWVDPSKTNEELDKLMKHKNIINYIKA